MKPTFFFLSIFFCLFSKSGYTSCNDSIVVRICESVGIASTTQTKTITVYDSLGHMLSTASYIFNGTNWMTNHRQVNAYDASGNLILHTYEMGNGFNGWYMTQRNSYTYNTNNQVLSYLHENSFGGAPLENSSYATYVYDVLFHLIETTGFQWDDTYWRNYNRTFFYPDALGNDTLIVYENGDSLGWHNYLKKFRTYNSDNLVVHDSLIQWNPGSQTWYLYQDQYLTYDTTALDSVMSYSYNSTGALTGQSYTLFISDSLNRTFVRSTYMWDGFQWYHDAYTDDSTYYDVWGNIIRSISASGTINAVYDSLGNLLYEDHHYWALSGDYTYYYYLNGVLGSSYSVSSTQGGLTTTTSCGYHYADVAGPAFMCGNNSVTLTATPCDVSYQFLWSTGETTSSITVNTPGVYSVTITYPGGFASTSYPFHVYASSAATVSLGNDTVMCVSEMHLLNAGYGYASYFWSDSSLSQAIIIYDSIPETINYWVQVTDSMGCPASDTIQVSFEFCTGIAETQSGIFTIFPNPATNQFDVRSLEFGAGKSYLEIFNTLGEKIYSAAADGSGPWTVDCGHFPRGIYFVRLYDNANSVTQKLIIQ